MLKVIRSLLAAPQSSAGKEPSWLRDPLAHPALARMTPDELADLPLSRTPFAGRTAAEPCRNGQAGA